MHFGHDDRTTELIERLETFMAERIVPSEPLFHEQLGRLEDRWAYAYAAGVAYTPTKMVYEKLLNPPSTGYYSEGTSIITAPDANGISYGFNGNADGSQMISFDRWKTWAVYYGQYSNNAYTATRSWCAAKGQLFGHGYKTSPAYTVSTSFQVPNVRPERGLKSYIKT